MLKPSVRKGRPRRRCGASQAQPPAQTRDDGQSLRNKTKLLFSPAGRVVLATLVSLSGCVPSPVSWATRPPDQIHKPRPDESGVPVPVPDDGKPISLQNTENEPGAEENHQNVEPVENQVCLRPPHFDVR